MDRDSIGTIENNGFLTLTLHALSMEIVMVLCVLWPRIRERKYALDSQHIHYGINGIVRFKNDAYVREYVFSYIFFYIPCCAPFIPKQ